MLGSLLLRLISKLFAKKARNSTRPSGTYSTSRTKLNGNSESFAPLPGEEPVTLEQELERLALESERPSVDIQIGPRKELSAGTKIVWLIVSLGAMAKLWYELLK